jgi:hypothetical protein
MAAMLGALQDWDAVFFFDYDVGDLSLTVDHIEPNYGFLVATSADGRPLANADRVLLLAATNSENQNMQWNEDRTSVGQECLSHWDYLVNRRM